MTGAVNMVEREEAPRSPSPQWSLSFKRKCRARNLIGCDGNHVMLQCEKLLSLGLAERREVLERSGLCTFCLKHSAELECYGKGGLSKPRCTHPGCDGEHTPGVHMLMGKGDAEVNLVEGDGNETGDEGEAEDGYEYEDEYGYEHECEGWWVGTVGAMETLEGTDELPDTTANQGQTQDGDQDKVGGESRAEWERDLQVDECSEGEMAGDERWDLELGYPSLGEEEADAPQPGPS